jgi:BON domain
MGLLKSSLTAVRDGVTASERTPLKIPARLCGVLFALILASALPVRPSYAACGSEGCPDDVAITTDVQKSFAQYPVLKAPSLLHVQTLNSVVYLSGTVSSGLHSEIAESVARQVKGVTRVVNSISVSH